ncbi:hypothetical protein DFP73DRAFT_114367 [Morchella snyderi]|nr:hypothetical protein DFP73DRAFT_114367 [Morchella snyderi]
MVLERSKRIRLKRAVAFSHIAVATCTLSSSICTAVYVYKPNPCIVPLTVVLMLTGSVLYLALCIFDYLLVGSAKSVNSTICICRSKESYEASTNS